MSKERAGAILAAATRRSIAFTSPNGKPIWIVKDHIVAIGYPIGGVENSYTRIWTVSGMWFDVREQPSDVAKVVKL